MQKSYGSPKSPITFTYTHRDDDDSRSIMSSTQTSTLTYTHQQRLNQLRPTPKVKIPPRTRPTSPKKQSPRREKGISLIENTSERRAQSEIIEPFNIPFEGVTKSLKWNGVSLICGVEDEQLGQHGCLCRQPCRWKQEWTRNRRQKD